MKHLLLGSSMLPITGCAALQVEATPHYGLSQLEGDFAIATGGITGTNDVGDLGLDDEEAAPGVRADLRWGMPHLTVTVTDTSWSGSGTTTADLSQDGVTIPAGSNVDSEVDLVYGNAIVTFDFVPGDTFEVGLGFGLEAASVQTSVRQVGLGAVIDTDEDLPIPVIALRAGVDLGPVSFDGLLAGISMDYDGDSLTFYDVDLRGRWEMFDHAHLMVGYKRWVVDLEYEDGAENVELDITADGPYFGIVIAF